MRLSRSLALVVGSLLLTGIGCSEEADPNPSGTGGSQTGSGGSQTGSGGASLGTGGTVGSAGGSDATGGTSTGTGGGAACPEDWGTTGEEAGITGFENIYQYFDKNKETGECYSMITTTATEGQLCTEGSAAVVVDEQFSIIWGAGVGLQVTADAAFDLSAYTGFKFTIDTPPSAMRIGLMVDEDANSYFTETVAAGENTVFFNQLANGEWIDPPGTLDLTKIRDIQWQVPSNDSEAVPFDFCLSGIELITDEAPGTGGSSGSGGDTAAGGNTASGGDTGTGGLPTP